jgi:hypothetical protein
MVGNGTGVADNQNRGAAGMGGRTHATTNAWDPSMNSYAQQTFEAGDATVFIFYRNPDLEPSLRDPKTGLPISFREKASRRKILAWVYEGSWWVNLDSIDDLATALINAGDTAQAERFFGNRLVSGGGTWLEPGEWAAAYAA